ncbi:hypothetical protein [Methanoregula sp. PtaU1.Bin006]|nr:hypothetical protein [Methanoregula sp. PtaU1.Bin006]
MFVFRIALLTILVTVCMYPVLADFGEIPVRGVISKIDKPNNTISINTSTGELTGEVPDRVALDVFFLLEDVEAVWSNSSGGKWVTIAISAPYSRNPATPYFIGDPTKITIPLSGDFSLNITRFPDCSRCNGSICQVAYANISLFKEGNMISEIRHYPKENASRRFEHNFSYYGRYSHDAVYISYVYGDMSSESCTGVPNTGDCQPKEVVEYWHFTNDTSFAVMHPDPATRQWWALESELAPKAVNGRTVGAVEYHFDRVGHDPGLLLTPGYRWMVILLCLTGLGLLALAILVRKGRK